MSAKIVLTIGILAHVDAGKTSLTECMYANQQLIRNERK
ncbi:GTP-binding protein [Marivirga salinae]|uniref:GTP-binding protein n=1 Tax=Marivirga salinarum TaxID=3059078 RepID=A0AA51RCW5_9BACT|nr:GTP-binding protein [Marivirga sp. BDSF4-3]WMN12258.1 GTP-binding protein [Marivirga sp. BDSF4-3]